MASQAQRPPDELVKMQGAPPPLVPARFAEAVNARPFRGEAPGATPYPQIDQHTAGRLQILDAAATHADTPAQRALAREGVEAIRARTGVTGAPPVWTHVAPPAKEDQ